MQQLFKKFTRPFARRNLIACWEVTTQGVKATATVAGFGTFRSTVSGTDSNGKQIVLRKRAAAPSYCIISSKNAVATALIKVFCTTATTSMYDNKTITVIGSREMAGVGAVVARQSYDLTCFVEVSNVNHASALKTCLTGVSAYYQLDATALRADIGTAIITALTESSKVFNFVSAMLTAQAYSSGGILYCSSVNAATARETLHDLVSALKGTTYIELLTNTAFGAYTTGTYTLAGGVAEKITRIAGGNTDGFSLSRVSTGIYRVYLPQGGFALTHFKAFISQSAVTAFKQVLVNWGTYAASGYVDIYHYIGGALTDVANGGLISVYCKLR